MSPIDPERLRERLVQLTRDLVLIESTDTRPEERRRGFELIRNHLEEIPGIELRRLEKNGYESLVVMPAGLGKPEVLFCGHLDVVEHPDPGCYRSEVWNGLIVGPGAGDMKGQLAVLMELCRLLWQEHPGLPIGLVVTSDEERGGQNGVKFLVEEAGLDAAVVVIPDGGSLTDITVEEKGILRVRLRSNGWSAHAARPWLGENAIENLIAGISRIRTGVFDPLTPPLVDPDDLATHWFPTCAVTILSTKNESANRIPDEAEAVLDIRFPPPHTAESMLEAVRGCLGPRMVAEFIVSSEPTHLAPDPRFAEITAEVTGAPVRLVRACGGSDGRYFCRRGVPVILSRPKVGNLHGHDEWIEIDSMLTYFEICRRFTLEKAGVG